MNPESVIRNIEQQKQRWKETGAFTKKDKRFLHSFFASNKDVKTLLQDFSKLCDALATIARILADSPSKAEETTILA